MALGITTMLSIVAMSNNVFDDAPRTSYLKAIDVWILTCFTITFVTLAETVVVIYLESNQQEQGRDSITILKIRKVKKQSIAILQILSSWTFVMIFVMFLSVCMY